MPVRVWRNRFGKALSVTLPALHLAYAFLLTSNLNKLPHDNTKFKSSYVMIYNLSDYKYAKFISISMKVRLINGRWNSRTFDVPLLLASSNAGSSSSVTDKKRLISLLHMTRNARTCYLHSQKSRAMQVIDKEKAVLENKEKPALRSPKY